MALFGGVAVDSGRIYSSLFSKNQSPQQHLFKVANNDRLLLGIRGVR